MARAAVRGLVFSAALLLAAGPAAALSCLPWGVQDAYLEAAGSDKVFNVLAGRLDFDDRLMPRPRSDDPNDVPPLTLIPAKFQGTMLGAKGFSQPVSADLTLEMVCLGPWCGRLAPGQDYILFAEQRGDALVVSDNPCGGNALEDTPEAREQLLRCHRGGACEPSKLR